MNDNLNNWYANKGKLKGSDLEQLILKRAAGFSVPAGDSEAEALSRLKARISSGSQSVPEKKSIEYHRLTVWISSVAAVCLVIFGFWFFFLNNMNNKVVAERGSHIDHRLPDGSQVTINADSRITYNKEGFSTIRKVELEGEAFFRVEKGIPFQVSTRQAVITVLGTSFNVYSRDNDFKVSCITGRIRITAGGKSVEITPGESAGLENGVLISMKEKNPESFTRWIDGEFSYENSPLLPVFKEIERQFNVKFVAGDIKERYFTGSFTNKDLKSTLDIVCIPMGLTYEIGKKGSVFIKERTRQ